MKNLNRYEEYYKTLQLSENCSREELRKSYKKQIQLYHPDRLTDGTDEKAKAQERIKSLNLAYQGLLKYYKEHDALPYQYNFQENDNDDDFRDAFTFEPLETSIHQLKAPHKNRKRTIITLLFISVLTFYLFSDISDKTTPSNNKYEAAVLSKTSLESDKLQHAASQDQEASGLPNNEGKTAPNKEIKYFTIGSSVGKVIDAQGIPDKSIGNLWHYGESTITFKNGKVTNWFRHKDTPLNIDINTP